MIKFEHTLFALPFALAAAAIAARGHGLSVARLAGIVVAMAGARTAAMGFNRIVDRHIDAKNPRTAEREIPAGRHLAARRLDADAGRDGRVRGRRRRPGPALPGAVAGRAALALGYSLTKRFTALCHLFLGLAIAGGPGRRLDRRARRLRLGARPAHDRRRLPGSPASTSSTRSPTATSTARAGLHSIPARFGVTRRAGRSRRCCHVGHRRRRWWRSRRSPTSAPPTWPASRW